MDWRKLQYFVQVADSGSFTKAAEALALAQPALSQQVASLEVQLGVTLLYRTGRGVLLTDAGLEFLPRAQSLLAEMQHIKDDMASFRRSPRGKIVLGVPPSVSHQLISSFVLKLRENFPEIRLTIVEGSSGFVQEWLTKGRLDIGILYNLLPHPSISSDVLLIEDLSLVTSAGNPLVSEGTVAFKELADLPMILPSRPHGLRTLVDKYCSKHRVKFPVVLELDGAAMVRNLVSSGCGYTILPDVAVLHDVHTGELGCAKIVEPVITRTMVIACSNERQSKLTTCAAMKLLREQVEGLGLRTCC
ncbi:LysR substrate-binding domain-containing protein [Aurantimonas sp. C2-6-R+9]|uniref:LysR family transcriptional regulator n=1 Tax=unclassified Aurantimonas TaxID=2638230 RepID=UPI002E191635|nr:MULTISPECIES: LysR substrate-binding domain-containing protein [unclassified Aurantimonas]MEC5293282.1 LysR substrate-binding domain-containing protein [Aurantimonas sp. C2-3-R2]MEC5383417.1 LysR substrate-binding domain-containing protein [Aurantimonas sp. C2-6-R+9]MEC5414375.1 LysR substrate-binding domain-containing protein [Aurantimonas sp. C2-4-R8]